MTPILITTTPVFSALMTVEKPDSLGIDNTDISARNAIRSILVSGVGYKAVAVTQMAYRDQQVGLMLPSPQEQLEPGSIANNWTFFSNGVPCGWLVATGKSWSVNLNSLVLNSQEDNTLSVQVNADGTFDVVYKDSLNIVNATKYSTNVLNGVEYNSYKVDWPFDIDANVMLASSVTTAELVVPGRQFDVDVTANALNGNSEVIDFLEREGRLESFIVADKPEEMISIAVLALYNSWYGSKRQS